MLVKRTCAKTFLFFFIYSWSNVGPTPINKVLQKGGQGHDVMGLSAIKEDVVAAKECL